MPGWTSSSKVTQKIGFLDLSRELRDMIYGLALVHSETIDFILDEPVIDNMNVRHRYLGGAYTGEPYTGQPVKPDTLPVRPCAQLLATCRQVHAEASLVLYSHNRFAFSEAKPPGATTLLPQLHPNNLLKIIPFTYRSLVRDVSIACTYAMYYEQNRVACFGDRRMILMDESPHLQDIWRVILQQSRDALYLFSNLQHLEIGIEEVEWEVSQPLLDGTEHLGWDDDKTWSHEKHIDGIAEMLQTWATEGGREIPWQLSVRLICPYYADVVYIDSEEYDHPQVQWLDNFDAAIKQVVQAQRAT
ncbi:hypothetical protein EJ08DRAFT_76303 [Tothia fuscella]|uniref:DUF7730 domain-containing protein n=1 Tax=Tothia fuscella TaxID=1048955 RepID=A0A9P4NX99_9PEZI|nr:hypothetical protein EJ08DRAFT_76303 [Tothia fuscella]